MNNRIITSVAIGIGAAAVVFLLVAFIKWELDPGLWSESQRLITAFMAGICSFMAIWAYNIE